MISSIFSVKWPIALARFLTGIAFLISPLAIAGEADVIAATITQTGEGVYTVSATVLHADTGWDHYADAFDVRAPDGTVLKVRTLFHPHVEEQPFTRSLTGIEIPANVATVTVHAHDSVDGFGGEVVTLDVPR